MSKQLLDVAECGLIGTTEKKSERRKKSEWQKKEWAADKIKI